MLKQNPLDAKTPAAAGDLATLINHLGLASFPHALIAFLAPHCAFDTALVTIYKRGFKPILLYPTDPADISPTLANYLSTFYVLDPLHNAIEQGCPAGVLRLKQIAPDSFLSSEYYQTCYKEFALEDEINLLVELAPQISCALTLGRRSALGSVKRGEIKQLNALFPIIEALVRQFWALQGTTYLESGHSDTRMKQALNSFGRGLLTDREQQISALIVEGNSSKAIAQRLNISVGTVKVHRKHIHTKLNTSNQSEMFTLFIDHLNSVAQLDNAH